MNEIDKLIIKGICACKTNKQIAKELSLSVPTTALKINKIYAKLGVTTRYELIFKVTTEGII